jgi:peptide/nickel transport system substrate-binding protein
MRFTASLDAPLLRRSIHILMNCCLLSVTYVHTPARAQTPERSNERLIIELTKPIEIDPNSGTASFNWFVRQADKKADRREFGAHQAMWEPLFLLNHETGNLDPWLGERLEPEPAPGDANRVDFKKWKLTLKAGLQWSDRQKKTNPLAKDPPPPFPFTSADVVATVKMALDNYNLTALEAVRMREQVESVEAANAQVVIFNLRKPNPRFAIENFGGGLFSSFLVMPKHHWDGQDAAKFRFAAPIGTGPYAYQSVSDKGAIWKRNDIWWEARYPLTGVPKETKKKNEDERAKYPKEIEWLYVADEDASKELLKEDKLDAAREYSKETLKQVRAKNANVIDWDAANPAWTDPCTRQLDINLQHSWPDLNNKGARITTPWADARLRQALALLIDREKLAGETYEGLARPSVTMFPAYGAMNRFRDAAMENVDQAIKIERTAKRNEADALLVAAGYTKDPVTTYYKKGADTLTATIWVNAGQPNDMDAAKKLAAQMVAAGIKMTDKPVTNAEYWSEVIPKGKYEMAYGWLSCGSIVEPYTSMRRYTVEEKDGKVVRPPETGVRSPGFDNTGRWTTKAAESYSAIVKKLGERPVDGNLVTEVQKKQAQETQNLVKEAYKYLHEEMPFIPLLHAPRIVPVSEKYWKGWPTGANSRPPLGWSQTQRALSGLKKQN